MLAGFSDLSLDTSYFAPPEEEYRQEHYTLSDVDLNTIHEKGESQMASFSPTNSTRPQQPPPPFSNPLYSSSPASSAAVGKKPVANHTAGYQTPQHVQEFLAAGMGAPMLLPPPAHARMHSLSLQGDDNSTHDPRIPLSSNGRQDSLEVTSVDYSRSSVRSSLGSPPSGSHGAPGKQTLPSTALQPNEFKKRPPAVRTSIAKPPISQSAGRSGGTASGASEQASFNAHGPLGYAKRQNEPAPDSQHRGRGSNVASESDLPRVSRATSREPSRRGMSVEPSRRASTVEPSGRGASVEPTGRGASLDPRSQPDRGQMHVQPNHNPRSHDHSPQDLMQPQLRRPQQSTETRGRPGTYSAVYELSP